MNLRKLIAAVLCGSMFAFCICINNGYGDGSLRIGLERYYMGVGTITAANTSLTVSYKGGSSELKSSSGFTFSPASGSYSSRIQCPSLENAVEHGGVAVFDNEGWGCYISDGITVETTTETTTQTAVTVTENSTETTTQAAKTEHVINTYDIAKNAVKVDFEGGSFVINTGGVTLSSPTGVVDLGEMSYRGSIEITAEGGSLNAVNIISMDEYLYGVIPVEVYASWPEEALKAQAVAARSFASYHKGRHSGYDLCDTTHCQFYSGYGREESSTTAAVDATSGVMAYYNGKPINAEYFDCDGGYTLSSSEVWGGDVPYLTSTPDPYELNARSWERTFTLKEIGNMAAAEGFDIGEVTNVAVTEWRGDILAEEVTLTGTNGSHVLKGQDIKTFFKQGGENLWSRAFKITGSSAPSNNIFVMGASGTVENLTADVMSAVNASGEPTVLDDINLVLCGKNGDVVLSENGGTLTEAADSIVISGAGWGHGVGMSQCGAYGMASKGFKYDEILKYYYKGVEVK